MGRIDDVKHDADVMERVLGIADHPPNYQEVHTDVLDLEVHPWLTGSRFARDDKPSSQISLVKGRRERS